MAFDLTALKKILKRRYYKGSIPDATLKNFPFFAMIAKNNDFSGDYYSVPIKYAHQQGRSHDIARAIANNGNARWDRWLVDVVPDYVDAQVPREAALRTSDSEQYIKMFADAIDDGNQVVDQNTAGELYRSAGGYRGRLSHTSGISAAYITLADPSQEAMFEGDMTLRASALSTGASIEVGSVRIGQIDRENGRIYTANGLNWDNAANIPTLAVDMYLYQDGDQTLGMTGLSDWLLDAAPTAGVLHWGVDRYVDNRLYGTYMDGSAYPIDEALKRGLSKCGRRGGRPDRVFLHPDNFQDLDNIAMSSGFLRRDVAASEKATYGFEGIVINYGFGQCVCVSDPCAIKNTAFGLEMSTWGLTYMGPKVGSSIIDEDGQLIRMGTADTYDIRCGIFGNPFCTKPGNSVRIKLA